jgi:hypothetical protein
LGREEEYVLDDDKVEDEDEYHDRLKVVEGVRMLCL